MEYKVEVSDGGPHLERRCNELAAEGWRVVSVWAGSYGQKEHYQYGDFTVRSNTYVMFSRGTP